MASTKTSGKTRVPRLGKGLSALMAKPVPVEPQTAPEPTSTAQGRSATDRLVAPHTDPGTKPAATARDEDPAISPPESREASENRGSVPPGEQLHHIRVTQIAPNPHQPRQRFEPHALERLANSIKTEGLMQPVVVRPASGTGASGGDAEQRFELVAGERRWRAAKLAGLERVPALVRELDERQLAEWALIENLQREDLNPIERAQAFQYLIDQHQLSQDEVARRVGVERPTIANSLRLLQLCDTVRDLVREGLLSAGQAKALVPLNPSQQMALAKRAVTQGLSVRQVESAVRALGGNTSGSGSGGQGDPGAADGRGRDGGRFASAHLSDLEQQIGRQLGTKVKLKTGRRKGSGALTIQFFSVDQFDQLTRRLGVELE